MVNGNGIFTRASIGFICAFAINLFPFQNGISSALDETVNGIEGQTTSISSTTANLSTDVLNLIRKYKMTNAGQCALLVIGTSTSSSVPVYFIPGTDPVAGLQADIVSSVPVTNVAIGPEGSQAGKQVGWNNQRFLVFGINSTPLIAGTLAVISLDTSKIPPGFNSISLANFLASDANANLVPLCVTSGEIFK